MSHSDMISQTRVLFTESGQPVPGLAVRSEAGDEIETDENGQVELSFENGRQQLEVFRDGIWVPQVIDGSTDSSLIIVDLARRDTREMKAVKPETSFLDIGKLNLGDRYSYHEVLGRGGMSVVIRARDRLLHRDVAIKVLSQELASDPEAQNLFLTEARNLATLSHPNLVAVHDICKVDEQVFIVIEYVEGESLEKLVRGVGGLSEQAALRTLVQLARVVSYMHEHGVIHRDLKPSNALIRQDGTLKLIDFGLARRFDDLYIRGTRVRGTPAYMSPEQFKGEPLTAACDVYMLGVCMFQVLTGELPFPKGDMGFAHVYEEAPRVETVNAEVSEELGDVVAACLEKKPSDRPGDGKELLRLLQNIYQGRKPKTPTLEEVSAEEEEAELPEFTPNDPDTVEFVGDIADVERFGLQTTADAAAADQSADAIEAVMEAADATSEETRDHASDDPDESAVIEFEVDDLDLDDEDLGDDEPESEPAADEEASLPPSAPAPPPASADYAAEAAAMERALRVATEEQAKTSAEVARLSALLSDPDVQRRLKSEPRSITMLPIMAVAIVSALVVAVIFEFDYGTETAAADATETAPQFTATPTAAADPLPQDSVQPDETEVDPAVVAAIEASENASSTAVARAVESHDAVSEPPDAEDGESPAETTPVAAGNEAVPPTDPSASAEPTEVAATDSIEAETESDAAPTDAVAENVATAEGEEPGTEKTATGSNDNSGNAASASQTRKVEKSSTGFLKPLVPRSGATDQGAR